MSDTRGTSGGDENASDSGLKRGSPDTSGTNVAANGTLWPTDPTEHMAVIVIGDRVLFRDCLAKCLAARNCLVATFSTVTDWQKAAARHATPSVIVLCSGANAATEIQEELLQLARARISVPVVLLSEAEDVEHVLVALDHGARGYIPTSVNLDVAVEALRLVGVGGTFIPATCVRSPRPLSNESAIANTAAMFTTRELAVLGALREGKANKRVAYDLNMSESTVKVHVRNIMKKLRARNRTEVAFLTRDMFSRA
jgi:DNA-binding NarL/FixJ family response regulator